MSDNSDKYSPYFDQDEPELPIDGMIADLDLSEPYELDAVAVFKCGQRFLIVSVSGCSCWPDRGCTDQSVCESKSDVDRALTGSWRALLVIDTPRDDLFMIGRTSGGYTDSEECNDFGEPKPCDGAVLYRMMRIDRRSVDDPKKVPAYYDCEDVSWWYGEGTNHRVENGCICRDMGYRSYWFVMVPDIMDFLRQHGQCVVGIDTDGFPWIEIYDDYRE